MKYKSHKRPRTPRCPYCGSVSVLRDSSYVYQNDVTHRKLYVCARYPACDSYVSAHRGSLRPEGTLANSELRNRRIRAHKALDRIWQLGIMSRADTYLWLQDTLGVSEAQAHIGMCAEYYCDRIIDASNQLVAKHTGGVSRDE